MKLIPKLVCIIFALCAHATLAQTSIDKAPAQADVRVVIDISGSMKQNDPGNLRRPALELLVQLIPKDSKAGVWLFGEDVDVLMPNQVISERWRVDARKRASLISSSSLYTNIPQALDQAGADPDRNYRTSIILLTDGMVDISKSSEENVAARQRLLEEILPRLRQAGTVVHTIALSRFADRELMERLAADTGGLFAVAENADALNKIFVQALDASAPAEQVPLAGNRFLVDSSIDELTALVFRREGKPVELLSPEQKTYTFASHGDDIKWFQGAGFDLITVKKPFEGEWTVDADIEAGSRVTIVSNLSLAATRYSESLFSSDDIPALVAALKQQGEVVTQKEFLQLMKFSASAQRREDGKQWDLALSTAGQVPADGYFRGALAMLKEPGTYDLAIEADGKTFQRSQKQTVSVRDNFTVRVSATDGIPPAHRVTLIAQNPTIDAASAKVTAHIKAPDGDTTEKVVEASVNREWEVLIDNDDGGRHEVYFAIEGKFEKGEPLSYRSSVVAIDANGNKVIAPAQQDAPEPIAAVEPAPAAATEPAKEGAPAAAEASSSWKKWALYGGLALGNLVLLGLGYMAYRKIMGGGKSKVLEEEDEDDEGESAVKGKDAAGAAKEATIKPPKKPRRVLDLPDDAIDIDGGDNKK